MPLFILLVIRLWRAFEATFRLLADVQLLRSLPWSHIRRLPLRDGWIGVITASLLLTLGMSVALLATPSAAARGAIYGVGLSIAIVGLASSWLRWFLAWERLRR